MAVQRQFRAWSPTTKLVVALFLAGMGGYLLFRFRLILLPLALAAILAFILAPIAGILQQRLPIGRGLATALVYLLLFASLALVPALFVPVFLDQLADLNLDFQSILHDVQTILERPIHVGGFSFNGGQLADEVIRWLQGAAEPALGRTLGFAIEIIGSAAWAVFVVVISFYLVKDGSRFLQWIEGLMLPDYRRDFVLLKEEINAIWSAFLRGQLILALVVSILLTVIGFILGLPGALAMGILAGLMEFIPSLGHVIWLSIASVLMFFQGSTWLALPNWVMMLILIGVHIVFGQVDLNYLIPRIVGRRVHLHPLVVILGIVVGASLAGVLGIVLAAPTISSMRILGRYLYCRLFDMDPFSEKAQEEGGDVRD
jgi:predicted PurR-regulated permease PerM